MLVCVQDKEVERVVPVPIEVLDIDAVERRNAQQHVLGHELSTRRIDWCMHNLRIELSSINSGSAAEFEEDRSSRLFRLCEGFFV